MSDRNAPSIRGRREAGGFDHCRRDRLGAREHGLGRGAGHNGDDFAEDTLRLREDSGSPGGVGQPRRFAQGEQSFQRTKQPTIASPSRQIGRGNGSKRLTSWSSLRMREAPRRCRRRPTGSGVLPSQRSRLSNVAVGAASPIEGCAARRSPAGAHPWRAEAHRRCLPSRNRSLPAIGPSQAPPGSRRRSGAHRAPPASGPSTPALEQHRRGVARLVPGWSRRNFSTIIVLPLFVGPTTKQVGHSCPLWERQHVLDRRQRGLRSGISDPAIGADPPQPRRSVFLGQGRAEGCRWSTRRSTPFLEREEFGRSPVV